jgi:hypothetical protein
LPSRRRTSPSGPGGASSAASGSSPPDGRQIGEERKLGRGEIAQGLTQADEVELPNLEDGYYRVTARAGDEAGSESSQLYVRVKKGQQEPVSFDEWYTKSGAGDFGGPDAPADGEKR